MNTLFKAFAALAAAFTLVASAFAVEYKPLDGAKVYDCRLTGNSVGYKTEVLTEYTDDEIRGLAAAGLKPTSRKYWIPTTFRQCEDLMVKKPAPKKAEVKALGGKPEIANPKKALVSTEYCNNGVVYYLSITFGNIRDAFIGGACQVDPKKTLVLAGL